MGSLKSSLSLLPSPSLLPLPQNGTFIVVLFVKRSVVFHLLFCSLNNYVSLRYIQLILGI